MQQVPGFLALSSAASHCGLCQDAVYFEHASLSLDARSVTVRQSVSYHSLAAPDRPRKSRRGLLVAALDVPDSVLQVMIKDACQRWWHTLAVQLQRLDGALEVAQGPIQLAGQPIVIIERRRQLPARRGQVIQEVADTAWLVLRGTIHMPSFVPPVRLCAEFLARP